MHISFVSKTYLDKAPIAENRFWLQVTFERKFRKYGVLLHLLKISFFDHFQHPKKVAHNVFLNMICTVWKEWNFYYLVREGIMWT